MTALAASAIEAREIRNALGGAIGIHSLLAIALLISLNWRQELPKPVQAELWGGLPGDIPRNITPPAATAKADLPPPPPPAPEQKTDISLQKKKAESPKKQEPTKAELQKEKELRAAQKKQALKKEAEEQAAALESQRKAELARLGIDPNAKANSRGKDVATKIGVSKGAELGAKTGIDADYEATIQARIKARINYPDRSPGNPEATVVVEQLPTGEIIKVKLTKPSGTPAWDDAVQRAIWASSPLPKRKDGTVARILELNFKPKENR